MCRVSHKVQWNEESGIFIIAQPEKKQFIVNTKRILFQQHCLQNLVKQKFLFSRQIEGHFEWSSGHEQWRLWIAELLSHIDNFLFWAESSIF